MSGLRTNLLGKEWRTAKKPTWRLHDLRRTTVTLAQQGGAAIEEICALTQHRTPGVIGVYARHSYSDEKRQVANVIARRIRTLLQP